MLALFERKPQLNLYTPHNGPAIYKVFPCYNAIAFPTLPSYLRSKIAVPGLLMESTTDVGFPLQRVMDKAFSCNGVIALACLFSYLKSNINVDGHLWRESTGDLEIPSQRPINVWSVSVLLGDHVCYSALVFNMTGRIAARFWRESTRDCGLQSYMSSNA